MIYIILLCLSYIDFYIIWHIITFFHPLNKQVYTTFYTILDERNTTATPNRNATAVRPAGGVRPYPQRAAAPAPTAPSRSGRPPPRSGRSGPGQHCPPGTPRGGLLLRKPRLAQVGAGQGFRQGIS